MFGDWGAHIIDFAHDYLDLGLPKRVKVSRLEDYNKTIFPLSSHIEFDFPKRSKQLPAVKLIWKAGGADYLPKVSEAYADRKASGELVLPEVKDVAGTLLHRAKGDYLIQRGHHESVSRLFPRERMRDFREHLKAPSPSFTHGESFTEACMGNGNTESPFSRSGTLSQVLNIGMIAEYLNEDLKFNPKSKRFVGNKQANYYLRGDEPRKEWADYYKIV